MLEIAKKTIGSRLSQESYKTGYQNQHVHTLTKTNGDNDSRINAEIYLWWQVS